MYKLTGLAWTTSVKIRLLRLARGTGILLICLSSAHQPLASDTVNYADCLHCHQGIESISDNHRFPCARCHLPAGERQVDILKDHEKIVRNPSGPEQAEAFCGPCHKTDIEQLRTSLHSTMAGVINQTRFLWGAQAQAAPALYGLSGGLMPLPEPVPEIYPQSTAMLVDDFLRRRCLRCHIHTKGPTGLGIYRATGCAACHVLYDDDGRYKGEDAAIDRTKAGYPTRHAFTVAIPTGQCLHCHNHNHVGADYEGLFEHDYHDAFRSPLVEGRPAAMRYGLDYHRLARDVHGEKGLWCIDCHTRDHVMGDGHVYSFQMEVPKRPCTDCHGGFDERGPDETHPSVQKGANGPIFVSKNQGRQHRLPPFRPEGTGHRIEAHARVRCSACHAQWSFQDYGMSVMREDRIHDYKWLDLTVQGDPLLQKGLKACAESPDTAYPMSMDYLSGREREGIWSVGWRFRRWAPMPLGMDQAGQYTILRPLYQYLVTYVDRGGNVVLDSVTPRRGDGSGRGWAFMPYVPHTTAPFGRSCTACHMNSLSTGQGIQDELTHDTVLTVPSPPPIPLLRLLKPQEAGHLLIPPCQWHQERLRALR